MLVIRSCFLITLIRVSELVTWSPIELLWTAKKLNNVAQVLWWIDPQEGKKTCLIMFQLMLVRVFHFLPTPNISNVGFIKHSFFPPQCFFTCIKSVAFIQKISELKPENAQNKCHSG